MRTESSEDEYDEEETSFPCKDLYSDNILDSAVKCWNEAKTLYGIDVQVLKERHNLDEFSYIRMVNYIRSDQPTAEYLMSCVTDEEWKDPRWMKPVIENDPLLMYDLIDSDGDAPDSGDKSIVKCLVEDVERMRQVVQRLVLCDSKNDTEKAIVSSPQSLSALIGEEEDQCYAGAYAHFGIHHEMLSDDVRTSAYKNAIEANADSVIKNKRVLDLGCGTGILSLFCARAGASSVMAVDMSDIIIQATAFAYENGMQDKISFKKGRLENISDIEGKFDVIVSEWMGYFLLFEGMLDSVIEARDKYLQPDTGRLMPNRCSLYLTAVSDLVGYDKAIRFWDDVYGFKMSSMAPHVMKEASVDVVPQDNIISDSAEIINLNLEKCSISDYASFSKSFELKILKNGEVTAICGHFDTFFELPQQEIILSTSPFAKPTHWKQTVFFMKTPLSVTKGESLKGVIKVRRQRKDARSLNITITLEGHDMDYNIN